MIEFIIHQFTTNPLIGVVALCLSALAWGYYKIKKCPKCGSLALEDTGWRGKSKCGDCGCVVKG